MNEQGPGFGIDGQLPGVPSAEAKQVNKILASNAHDGTPFWVPSYSAS